MDSIISIRGLGKEYQLGSQAVAYDTLRESLVRTLTRGGADAAVPRSVWALREVNLEVAVGDVLGVIGRNGAGKSTLLKILSRITEPTVGEADLYGRAASLLEVGTGFHSELTGRDNIFLSGAILGMRREEIRRKFDDIVAFAEVAPFLDTPVKRYSTGMHMRLGFSVAAHLDPEILIIDEVLAVGDAQFQQKCLGKMKDVAREGRTVVFVSHNMAAIRTLCRRAVVLEGGRVALEGDVDECITRYLGNVGESGANQVDLSATRRGFDAGTVLRFQQLTLDSPGNRAVLAAGQPIALHLDVRLGEAVSDLELKVAVDTQEGVRVFECPSGVGEGRIARLDAGTYRFTCRIESNFLAAGRFAFAVTAWSGGRILDAVSDAMTFEIMWSREGVADGREDLRGLVRAGSVWTAPDLIGPP